MAQPASMKKRHRRILIGFAVYVLAPLIVVAFYLLVVAKDQYASTAGFTVRQAEGASTTDLMGGLAKFTGSSASVDADVLYEFIRSQALIRRIDEARDLRGYYAQNWGADPVFSLWPNASIEDLQSFWKRIVRVSYEQSSGMIEIEVLAFDAQMAQTIAKDIVRESQDMVNALNEVARLDSISYAETELRQAEQRLKGIRTELTRFRTRTQIVDLQSDIQGRMGVMNNLQQQLATELVNFDELSGTTRADDPRVRQTIRRIEVIRDRIVKERRDFATNDVSQTGEDYPTLISEFEGLVVEREFAEQTYRAALTSRDSAQAEAIRQSRYLAAYIEPTLAEDPEYPRHFVIFGLAALILVLSWGVVVLIYYSLRDRA